MLTTVPTRVDDPKDAVLWSIFDCLQKIDENATSRVSFGTSILYNIHTMNDTPVFADELKQLREILHIPEPVQEAVALVSQSRPCNEPMPTTIGDEDL